MNDLASISKFSALPAHLQAQAADFIDYLWQKAARTPEGLSDALQGSPVPSPSHTGQHLFEDDVEVLGPLLSDGSPRLPLKFGAGKHFIAHMADDFDAPLEDFKDYM